MTNNNNDNNNHNKNSFDHLLQKVGPFNRFQILQLIQFMIGSCLNGATYFAVVFYLKVPNHRCYVENLDDQEKLLNFYNISSEGVASLAIPLKKEENGCDYYDSNEADGSNFEFGYLDFYDQCEQKNVSWPEPVYLDDEVVSPTLNELYDLSFLGAEKK